MHASARASTSDGREDAEDAPAARSTRLGLATAHLGCSGRSYSAGGESWSRRGLARCVVMVSGRASGAARARRRLSKRRNPREAAGARAAAMAQNGKSSP